MTDLTKAEPPAWAVNLGLSLEDMANQNQILQQILKLASTNCQMQGIAAQAQAEQAEDIAENQSDQTMQDAYMSIAEGSFGLGSSLVSFGIEWGWNKSAINEASGKLQNLQGFEAAIGKLEDGSEGVALHDVNGHNEEDLANVNQLLNKPIENNPVTPEDKDNLELLNNDELAEFKKNLASKKKSLERKLQTYQTEKQNLEQRMQGLSTGISKMTNYGFNNQKASDQMASASLQYVKALADYLAQASNAANQTIMGQKDQIFNLMMSTAQELIGGMAQANQIR